MARLDVTGNFFDPAFPAASEPEPVAPTSIPIGPPVPPSGEGDIEDPRDLEMDEDSALGEIPPEPNDLDGFGLDESWN
jgi:hypothetical protein